MLSVGFPEETCPYGLFRHFCTHSFPPGCCVFSGAPAPGQGAHMGGEKRRSFSAVCQVKGFLIISWFSAGLDRLVLFPEYQSRQRILYLLSVGFPEETCPYGPFRHFCTHSIPPGYCVFSGAPAPGQGVHMGREKRRNFYAACQVKGFFNNKLVLSRAGQVGYYFPNTSAGK